jgi:HSP20 family protein
MFDLIPFEHRNSNLFNYFDRMMGDSFFSDFEKEMAPCRTDILDQGDKFVLKADLPGFQKEEININIEGDRLTLSAEHKEEVNDEKKDYVRRERRYGSMSRSFDIQAIDAGQISASYHDGVLELNLPKLVEVKPEAKQIEIK